MRPLQILWDVWERRKALNEFRAYDVKDKEQQYWDYRNIMREALGLVEADHRARALSLWRSASQKFPEQALKSEFTVKLLMKLQLYSELDELLLRGLIKHPSDPMYLEGLANSANEQRKFSEARIYAEKLIKRFPNSATGYLAAAVALSSTGDAEKAEKLLGRASNMLGDQLGIRIEYARLAERRQDWATALERWNDIYARFQHAAGISGALSALGHLGRYDEADALLTSVRHIFGMDFSVWVQHARIAEQQEDWVSATARWEQFRDRFPKSAFGFIEGARALRKLGRFSEAEALLEAGIQQVDPDPGLYAEYAFAAYPRSDWNAAAERWTTFRDVFPDRKEGYTQGSEIAKRLGKADDSQELHLKADKMKL